MKLALSRDERLFGESVRTAIADWQPPREPELGVWLDDRDDALAGRLAAAGWGELWEDAALLGSGVAGGLDLGRAAAAVCLVDEATLGGALTVSGRARHGTGARRLAVPRPGGGLGLAEAPSLGEAEPTLDGSGTTRVVEGAVDELPAPEAEARWGTWTAVTLAYLAGLAAAALERSVEHARTREQFGAPLAALPAVQARLADAALAADGLELLALASTEHDGLDAPALLWGGDACCEVTTAAHQVHGAIGFALETGLHVYHRRALSSQSWAAAVCSALR